MTFSTPGKRISLNPNASIHRPKLRRGYRVIRRARPIPALKGRSLWQRLWEFLSGHADPERLYARQQRLAQMQAERTVHVGLNSAGQTVILPSTTPPVYRHQGDLP